METLHSGLMPGGARLENLLNMFKRGDLGDPNGNVKTMRVLPLACKAVIESQKQVERITKELCRRSWKTFHEMPNVDDQILIRFPDEIEDELITWSEEEVEFFEAAAEEGEHIRWLLIPRA